jgi:hypothetical protein
MSDEQMMTGWGYARQVVPTCHHVYLLGYEVATECTTGTH